MKDVVDAVVAGAIAAVIVLGWPFLALHALVIVLTAVRTAQVTPTSVLGVLFLLASVLTIAHIFVANVAHSILEDEE